MAGGARSSARAPAGQVWLRRIGRYCPRWAALLACVCLLAQPASAAELKPQTAAAFDHYVQATEARLNEELREGKGFLWVDRLPESRRRSLYAQLRQGAILTERLHTLEQGKPIRIPDGLVHHWVGVVFIPRVTLQQTLALLQNYDNHQNIFRPEVRRSKLLARNGDDFKVFLQFYKKTIITVVLDADFDIHYFHSDSPRAEARSYSTRMAEVENVGQTDEREKPVGAGHGYLWRLNSYWRFEEKEGGVYVQLENIALTRNVPAIFAWLINPLLSRIPRETISGLLNATRKALVGPGAAQRNSQSAEP